MSSANSIELKSKSALKKPRQSNLELFRIITMLLIVAHHYVVNSGLTHLSGPVLSNPFSAKSIALLLAGAWGKTGINCFVLITGYFMCKSQITAKKFFKLLLEVEFYSISINLIFWVTGYAKFSIQSFVDAVVPIIQINSNFTACFLVFFLFIPFLNILVNNMNQKQHLRLLALCLFLYTFLQTFPFFGFSVVFNYVSWFSVLYFVSSYVRLYPSKFFDKTSVWFVLMLISFALSSASVLYMLKTGYQSGMSVIYEFVSNSNTFLALTNGFCAFMFFKNLNIKNNRFINFVASSTFGVFLIHTCGVNMRNFLWKDLLKNVDYYNSPYLFVHFALSVLGVFVAGVIIDKIRIYLFEKPFLKLWDKRWDKCKSKFEKIENKVFKNKNAGESK